MGAPERPDIAALPPPSDARRRISSAMFLAAVFGVVAVLSLPVGELLNGPLGSIFPWSGPLGGILHGAIPPAFGPDVRASGPGDANGGPGGGSLGGPPGSVSGGGPIPEPVPVPPPEPRPVPAGPGSSSGDLKGSVSDLDRATLALLNRLVGNRDLQNVLGRMSDRTDRPDATATLLSLTAQGRLAELQSRVTPAQLHALLKDLRGILVRIVPSLPGDWRHEPLLAGGAFRSSGPPLGSGLAPSTTWGRRPAFVPRFSKHGRPVHSVRRKHHHHK